MDGHYLVVLTNPVEGQEDEYNEWYTGHHLDDVLAVEGFRAAQRFKLHEGKLTAQAPFRYLALYEVGEGDLERAEAALLAVRAERGEALAAGRAPIMPLSPALDTDLRTWWFTPITSRREASAGL